MQKIIQFFLLMGLIPAIWAADSANSKLNIHQYQLSNGLSVIVKVDKRAPVVLSEIWYHVGAGYEHTGITGLSHALEHMMYKGTPNYPKGEFFNLIANNGGQQNAMTGVDYTVYYQELAADKLALSFKLEADRMQHLTLAPEDFTKELKVVQEERKMRIDNDPMMLTYERYNASAFIDNPYGNPGIGWDSDLQQMTATDLRKWYETWYVPNNATLVVVGDVNPEKVYELAQQYFGAIKAKPLPELKKFVLQEPRGVKTVHVQAPAKLPIIYLGFNVPSVVTATDSYEPYALEVLSTILGGTKSSRLQRHLVRDKQIASDLDVRYDLYSRLPSLFEVAAVPTEKVKIEQLKNAILAEIDNLKMQPIPATELEKIKTQVIAQRIYAQDSLSYIGIILGSLTSVGLPVTEIDNYQTKIEQITPEQIQETAKKYLNDVNLTVGILDPLPLPEGQDKVSSTVLQQINS